MNSSSLVKAHYYNSGSASEIGIGTANDKWALLKRDNTGLASERLPPKDLTNPTAANASTKTQTIED